MKKQTYIFIRELCQLTLLFLAVMLLSAGFGILSKWLKPKPLPALDNMELYEMQKYHASQGKSNIIFFE